MVKPAVTNSFQTTLALILHKAKVRSAWMGLGGTSMPIGSRRKHGDRSQVKKGWMARLARDTSGNTLAIVGAALVPLAGMIGSGVDMSCAYMAKTRLQSACDSAAL